jgi:type II secretory pathway component GspD/PulD (secretin)
MGVGLSEKGARSLLGHEAIGTPDDGTASWGTKPTVVATMNEFSAEATLFEGIFFAQGVKRTGNALSLLRGALEQQDRPRCAYQPTVVTTNNMLASLCDLLTMDTSLVSPPASPLPNSQRH